MIPINNSMKIDDSHYYLHEYYNIEYTIHNCPKSMKNDVYLVFKNELKINDTILILMVVDYTLFINLSGG